MSLHPQSEITAAMTRWQVAVASLRSALGAPDYEAYATHRRLHHPDQPVLSRSEFFRERQLARYRRGASRCC